LFDSAEGILVNFGNIVVAVEKDRPGYFAPKRDEPGMETRESAGVAFR
jgi:hypothetical protein